MKNPRGQDDGFEKMIRSAIQTKKDPIKIKPENAGKLHKDLGVPAGEKIPIKKIESAEHSENSAVRKRAVFAANARRWSR